MASNVIVHSVLGTNSKDHLVCSICSCRFKEPKVLDCMHSFCLRCLQGFRQHQEPECTKLTCPLCRCDTQLKGNDVAALPNNFTLGALVEEFTMQENLLEGQGSEIKCQNCEEGNEAISRCSDCDSFFCLECNKAHARMAAMKAHEVNAMVQLRSGEVSFRSKLREQVLKCGKHPDQNVTIYCNTCEKLSCIICSIQDHEQHSLISHVEAFDKSQQEIAKMITKAMKNKTKWSKASTEVESIRETLYRMFTRTTGKISTKADKEVARIREEEQKLKQEAVMIYKERVKTLDTVQEINTDKIIHAERTLDETKQLTGHLHEILNFKLKLLHNLRELTMEKPQRTPTELSFMDFEESKLKSLAIGRLMPDTKERSELRTLMADPTKPEIVRWQEKTKINKFGNSKTEFKSASHVAVFSNYEVVIVDLECKNLISYFQKTPQSPATSKELEIHGLHNPKCVAVNTADQLIVLADSTVHIFSREYKPLCNFKTGTCKWPAMNPTCLAVDKDEVIAVGYETEAGTSVHSKNGCFLGWVSTPGIGHYLTTYKESLVYSNSKDRKLTLEKYKFASGHGFSGELGSHAPQNYDLCGVCCDCNGTTFVAISTDETGEIHQYSPDCRYLGCVIKGCKNVRGIALTPKGDLIAAAGNWILVYRRF
ncbi:E3 ubiquitin-protein ligase TRIM36-like isoform X2 [Acanthaster planci]|nr:E3 ubiquitin-protein ligase TRIM36-like isoform X2 [Acanthaster planci]